MSIKNDIAIRDRFRPDIEGLRAFSVVSVICFHAFQYVAPGGFIGVDVFFVISGFVITISLLSEYEFSKTIDITNFWVRRIKRILPLSSFVLVSIAFVAGIDSFFDSRAIGKDIISAALFFINYRFAAHSVEYLAVDHADDPLLHFWSLAVEEQYYLFWPVVLWCLFRFTKKKSKEDSYFLLIAVALGLASCSLTYSLYLTSIKPAFAFFDTLSRAWQLIFGGLLAIIVAKIKIPTQVAQLFGIFGILSLLSFIIFFKNGISYPGILALVPTFGAGLIILSGNNFNSISRCIFSISSLRYVGRVSFAWYLWHWPFLVFGHLWFGEIAFVTVFLVLSSFLAAILSYHFIESPIRYSEEYFRTKISISALALFLVCTPVLCGLGLRFFGFENLALGNGVFVSQESIRRDRPSIYDDRCLRRFNEVNDESCNYGAAEGPTVALLGDSHAAHWFEPLVAAAKLEGWRVLVRIKAACRPFDEAQTVSDSGRIRPYTECAIWIHQVENELARVKPDLIIVGSTSQDISIASELRTLDYLASLAPTLLVRGTPVFPMAPVDCLKRKLECRWDLATVLPSISFPKSAKSSLPARVEVIDLNDKICPDNICVAIVNGKAVMFDNHHLTKSFSLEFLTYFQNMLNKYKKI
jgi:peptidoglycan/LPS O-acetylase OafA/YrhL